MKSNMGTNRYGQKYIMRKITEVNKIEKYKVEFSLKCGHKEIRPVSSNTTSVLFCWKNDKDTKLGCYQCWKEKKNDA